MMCLWLDGWLLVLWLQLTTLGEWVVGKGLSVWIEVGRGLDTGKQIVISRALEEGTWKLLSLSPASLEQAKIGQPAMFVLPSQVMRPPNFFLVPGHVWQSVTL